ncbi:MAG: DUF6377 domain-containing protein [Rikenellaceae bacterium]
MRTLAQYTIFCLMIMLSVVSCTDEYSSLKATLRESLSRREENFAHRLQQIEQEEELLLTTNDSRLRFEICNKLFNLSRAFKYDIAYKYANESLILAQQIGDPNLVGQAQASMISTFSAGGLFADAADVIAQVRTADVSSEVRREIYYNIIRYYSDAHDYKEPTKERQYSREIQPYVDSLLHISTTNDYYTTYAKVFDGLVRQDPQQVIKDIESFYGTTDCTPHHNAIMTFFLGMTYFDAGDVQRGFYFLSKSVEHDVESATRENLSFKTIGEELYNRGEDAIADELINAAFEDAIFYNARHRNLEVGTLLERMNRDKIATISRQRNILYGLLLLTTLLGLLAIIFGVMARQSSQRIHQSKRIIERHLKNMSQINRQLEDTNRAKEHYIIESLQKSRNHIKSLDALLKKIDVKVKNRLYDDLRYLYKNVNIKRERESFFADFDHAFLRLFPNFIVEYNALFEAADQVIIDDNTELPTEVRIFALMRLGITDNEQIAKFLDLSINTIYTYKTKVKNKTIIPKEEFERRILEIRL